MKQKDCFQNMSKVNEHPIIYGCACLIDTILPIALTYKRKKEPMVRVLLSAWNIQFPSWNWTEEYKGISLQAKKQLRMWMWFLLSFYLLPRFQEEITLRGHYINITCPFKRPRSDSHYSWSCIYKKSSASSYD